MSFHIERLRPIQPAAECHEPHFHLVHGLYHMPHTRRRMVLHIPSSRENCTDANSQSLSHVIVFIMCLIFCDILRHMCRVVVPSSLPFKVDEPLCAVLRYRLGMSFLAVCFYAVLWHFVWPCRPRTLAPRTLSMRSLVPAICAARFCTPPSTLGV